LEYIQAFYNQTFRSLIHKYHKFSYLKSQNHPFFRLEVYCNVSMTEHTLNNEFCIRSITRLSKLCEYKRCV